MDSLKTFSPEPALDPFSYFLGFIKDYYLSNPTFWMTIFIVFLMLYIMRVLIFDNPKIGLNSKSWFYPAVFTAVIFFVVWLKNEAPFEFSKKYWSDLLTTAGGVTLLYMAFGHKLLAKLSEITPLMKDKPQP